MRTIIILIIFTPKNFDECSTTFFPRNIRTILCIDAHRIKIKRSYDMPQTVGTAMPGVCPKKNTSVLSLRTNAL